MSENDALSEKRDRRFLDLAKLVATWSKDPSTKVAAVAVRANGTVASIGYNGFPRGVSDNEDRYANREKKYAMIVHAENNALLNSRESLDGCTLYVTPLPPCTQCTAAIIQHGIKRVVIGQKNDVPEKWKEQSESSKTMFQEAGVTVVVIPEIKQQLANDNDDATKMAG